MKLSDAIRLGSMASDPIKCVLWRDGRTCALGAAFLAAGMFDSNHMVPSAVQDAKWPILAVIAKSCPCCRDGRQSVADMITHLNDYHTWTREAIADWVSTIEPPEFPDPQPVAAPDAARVGAE